MLLQTEFLPVFAPPCKRCSLTMKWRKTPPPSLPPFARAMLFRCSLCFFSPEQAGGVLRSSAVVTRGGAEQTAEIRNHFSRIFGSVKMAPVFPRCHLKRVHALTYWIGLQIAQPYTADFPIEWNGAPKNAPENWETHFWNPGTYIDKECQNSHPMWGTDRSWQKYFPDYHPDLYI